MCESLAVAEKSAAGVPEDEIEVTPEMIEAGERVLLYGSESPDFTTSMISNSTLKALYIAMRRLDGRILPRFSDHRAKGRG
jgi:hypothetical protein